MKVAEQTVQRAASWCLTRSQRCSRTNCARKLDVSFADANLAQAKLLLLDAQNNYQASLSMLSQILGYPSQQPFDLVDTETEIKPPPDAVSQLEDRGLQQPAGNCLAGLRISGRAAFSESRARPAASHASKRLGVVGRTPLQQHHCTALPPFTSWYGAIGVNVNIPIFNGFLYPGALERSRHCGRRLPTSSCAI